MNLEFIDIGVNLMSRQFAEDRDALVKESLNQKVGMIITGTDLKSDRAAVEYINNRQFDSLWCTCGMHPHNADGWNLSCRDQMRTLIEKNRKIIVAVGEAGLDYDRMFSTKENQKNCFSDILLLAKEWELPLFLHERAAEQDFVEILGQHKEICKRSVVHCFTGTTRAAKQYLDLGCFIGITGWICDERRNREVIEAIRSIPIERLMIETDAPYLTPRSIQGLSKRNVPENIKYVAEKLAEIKGIDVEIVKRTVLETTKKFFGI